MANGAGQEKFETRLASKIQDLGFDPTIILAILATIIPMILDCLKPTPKGIRKAGKVSILSTELRRKEVSLDIVESRQLAKAILEVLAASTDMEVQEFIEDCCE